MLYHIYNFLAIVSITTAFIAPGGRSSSRTTIQEMHKNLHESTATTIPQKKIFNQFQAATASLAAGAFLLSITIASPTQPAFAATRTNAATENPAAVKIFLDGIPPSSLELNAKSLPIIGGLISGRYAMVDDSQMGKPSITVQTPTDTIKTLGGLTGGHLEADLAGIVKGHLNVDIAATAGEATVKISSPLIPALPFKNSASGDAAVAKGKTSDWSKVVNMGSGDTYYYNLKAGVSQFDVPKDI